MMKTERRGPALLIFWLLLLGVVFSTACSNSDSTEGPPPTETPTAVHTATAASSPPVMPEAEVIAAYETYLEAYRQALLELDSGLVADHVAGEELSRVIEEIEGLRSQGLAMRVVTIHNPVVMNLSASSAVVFDEVVNNSFYVDAITKDPPVASGSGETLSQTFYLERVDGEWIVVRSERRR